MDQSFGARLMRCGLCTVPCHGEPCSTGAARCRRVGEAKGLSRSGVNGTVWGLWESPRTERAKTEVGVFMGKGGLGLIKSSVPETNWTQRNKIYKLCINHRFSDLKKTLKNHKKTNLTSQTRFSFHSHSTVVSPGRWSLQFYDRPRVFESDQPGEPDTLYLLRSSYGDARLGL